MCQVSHVVDSLAQGGQRLPGLLQFVESYQCLWLKQGELYFLLHLTSNNLGRLESKIRGKVKHLMNRCNLLLSKLINPASVDSKIDV